MIAYFTRGMHAAMLRKPQRVAMCGPMIMLVRYGCLYACPVPRDLRCGRPRSSRSARWNIVDSFKSIWRCLIGIEAEGFGSSVVD